jgi:hypothetical protein
VRTAPLISAWPSGSATRRTRIQDSGRRTEDTWPSRARRGGKVCGGCIQCYRAELRYRREAIQTRYTRLDRILQFSNDRSSSHFVVTVNSEDASLSESPGNSRYTLTDGSGTFKQWASRSSLVTLPLVPPEL